MIKSEWKGHWDEVTLPYAERVCFCSTAKHWLSLTARGRERKREREGEWGQWEGRTHLHEKSSLGQWPDWTEGISGSNRKWRVRLHTPPSFPRASEREREIKGERRGEQGRSKWAKQPSHSCCVRSQCGRMCRDLPEFWKQDRTRQKERETR